MPNHVKNKVEFRCSEERLTEVLDAICYQEPKQFDFTGRGSIDFNRIIPMPKSLDIESGSTTDYGIAYYLTERLTIPFSQTKLSKVIDNMFSRNWAEEVCRRLEERVKNDSQEVLDKLYKMGEQYIFNIDNYGFATWYDWCCKYWGTKWNSYDGDAKGNVIEFSTAWSSPSPIISKLAEMFPDVEIYHEWADEDIGRNCGYALYENGELVEEYYLDHEEAVDFAINVWGIDKEEWENWSA